MSRAIGPVLATGAVTMVNESILNGKPVDWRVPVATGLVAVGVSIAEKAWPKGATAMAWLMFATVMLTRVNPQVPSPTESIWLWWENNAATKYKPPGG
jgi:hypothetical protein